MTHETSSMRESPGLASSRFVRRLRSQDGRTRFFEELFGRTIGYRPSEDSKTNRDDLGRPLKNQGRNRTKDETDDIIDLSSEKCLTDIEAVVFL